jgi:hypothetical protein
MLPRSFYRIYFKSPFWWSNGVVGNLISVYVVWRYLKLHPDVKSLTSANEFLSFYGRFILVVTSILLTVTSFVVLLLNITDYPISFIFKGYFLYDAFGSFINFAEYQLFSVVGVFSGIAGLISAVYADEIIFFKPKWLPKGLEIKKGPDGANIENLRPEIIKILPQIVETWQECGVPNPTITSGSDGDHGINSLHYENLAIDIRGNDVSVEKLKELANKLKKRISTGYDVVPEPKDNPIYNHIHIEYDPKS